MRWPRPARAAASSSRSRSSRSPSAGAASPGPRASSSSSPARCPATACGPRSPRQSGASPRLARSSCCDRRRIGSPIAACTKASPARGRPGRGCPTSASSTHKSDQVDEALRRIGGLDDFELEEIEPAVEQWRYRNKLEYSFGERDGEVVLGFHARGRWDLVVGVEDCLLASERGNAARNEIRDWARLEAIPAYDRRSREGVLRNLVVREGWRTGQIQTRLVTSAARFPKPPVDLHTVIEGDSGGTDGPTGVLGEERLREELCGLKLEMSHGAFFQTNTEMAERLYAVAAEFAGLTGSERVFDLYCGIGTIGLTMAAKAGEVWGLELVPEAIADATATPRQRDRQRALPGGQRPHRGAAPARGGRQARRARRRPAPGRPLAEDRAAGDRVRGEADRLRLLQPDDAGPERRPAGRGRL